MPRTYTKSKRAENEAETRQRIVEATVALHTELGPTRTTIKMIAERAGVQRHTVYAHFPDDMSLQMACSGHYMEQNPLPTPDRWKTINDPDVRLRKVLTELYAWYSRNVSLMSNIMRDIEIDPVTRETTELRSGGAMRAIAEAVTEGLGPRGKAALVLALSFHTWRTLAEDAGLKPEAAAELMAATVSRADD